MKKAFCFFLMIAVFFLAENVTYSQELNTAQGIGASVEYWMSKLSGEAKSTSGSVEGTTIDLVDDLGVDDTDNVVKFNVFAPVGGNSRLILSYYSLSYSGKGTLEKTITFKGVNYTAGEEVVSKANADILDLKYKLYPFESYNTQVGLILGLKYGKTDTKVTSVTNGTQSGKVDIPLPQIGLVFRTDTPYVSLIGELSGLSLSYQDKSGSMVELDLRAEYNVTNNFGLMAGYRYYRLDAEQKNEKADFTISGLYAGGIARF